MFSSGFSRLQLELLNERIVPSVTVLDLTSRGALAESASGAIVQQGSPSSDSGLLQSQQPTELNSFLRIDGRVVEQGYNSDNRRRQFDEERGTHSLTLGQVPVVYVNGVAYREFILTINEHRWGSRLSLDELRIYLGHSGYLSGYNSRTQQLGGHSAVFDLDSGGNVSVLLRDRLDHCRRPDMTLLIPDAAFRGASPDTFVTLYSKFGSLWGARASGGAEIWSVREDPPPPARTAGGSISGSVLLDANQQGDFVSGIAGAVIHLEGTTDQGAAVSIEALTDADGVFLFENLVAGTYTVWEEQPSHFSEDGTLSDLYGDGADRLGTIEGTTDRSLWGTYDPLNEIDMFMDIHLGTGQHGVDYTFTEVLT